MSTIRTPVGPQPPSVYWRRRLLVLLGLIAVIIVIVLIVVRPGSGAPAGGPSGSPSPSDQASDPTPSGTPTFSSAPGGDACNAAQISVVAVTDATQYAAGVLPNLSMKIKNNGTAPCTFDVGTGAQEYVITSGNDRIWSSKDCQTGATNTPQVLQPGVELTTTPFAWDRTRSSTTTCTTTRPAAVANADGPTYRLTVTLGGVESEASVFRLFA